MTGLARPLTFPPLSGGPVRAPAGGRVAHGSAQPRPGPQARARNWGLCGGPARRRLQPQMQPSCKTRPSHLCPDKTARPLGILRTAFTLFTAAPSPGGIQPPRGPRGPFQPHCPCPGRGLSCLHAFNQGSASPRSSPATRTPPWREDACFCPPAQASAHTCQPCPHHHLPASRACGYDHTRHLSAHWTWVFIQVSPVCSFLRIGGGFTGGNCEDTRRPVFRGVVDNWPPHVRPQVNLLSELC